jgi:Domain of unknown function (DUF4384)
MKIAAGLFISFLFLQNAKEFPRQEGQATITIGDIETLSAAQKRAEDEALRDAVEKSTGREIIGDTIVRNSQLGGDWTRAMSQGIAFDRKIIETIPKLRTEPDGKWYIDLTVRLNAQVAPAKTTRHVFGAHISLDGKDQFVERENMHINVEVSEDAYVHIFNIGADGSVTTLIPNRYHTEKFLKKGTVLRFPSADEESRKISLTTQLPPGASSSKEQVKVIATRHDNLLLGDDFREAVFKVYDGKSTGLIDDLMKRVYNFDGADWSEDTAEYSIVKK